MTEPVPLEGGSYEELRRRFRWRVPHRFNIGSACTDAHAPDRLALLHVDGGRTARYTFGDLAALSNRVANLLVGLGLRRGDRVAVVLPQAPETALAHLGAHKAGMIGLPLSTLFGQDALRFRLADSSARVAVTDSDTFQRLEPLLAELPELETVLLVDGGGPTGRVRSLAPLLDVSSDRFTLIETAAEDPAMIIYTSGTTGPPKGVLHAHRVLFGQTPGFRLGHEFLPRPGDLVWTPADWAWIGGLVNTLLLTWFHGVPMVSAPRRGFDPEWALDLLARMEVRNAFLPTTALRMMLQHPVPAGVRLRSILSGGEPQEASLLAATEAAFGVMSNESYGQTEADFTVGQCGSVWPVRPGSMGRAYPGHQVELRSESGEEVEAGEAGEVVVRAPDPTIMLAYWNRPDATAAKFRDGWLRTGDLARMDEDRYLWFEARTDDVIKSAGSRIGPGEIEDCLLRHPDVAQAAVVGAPDPVRGQVVKAYVSLRVGAVPSADLEDSLRGHVRDRLAAYQYPRLIEFVTEFPMTTSGKVDRAALRKRAAESSPPAARVDRQSIDR